MGKDGLERMFSTQCIIVNLGHLRSPGERKVMEEITDCSEKIKETKGYCPCQTPSFNTGFYKVNHKTCDSARVWGYS